MSIPSTITSTTRKLSQQQGWGSDGIKVVPLGAVPARLAAMERGELDGMVVEAATGADAGELSETARRASDRHVSHVLGALGAEPLGGQLVGRPERAVEEDRVGVRRRRLLKIALVKRDLAGQAAGERVGGCHRQSQRVAS